MYRVLAQNGCPAEKCHVIKVGVASYRGPSSHKRLRTRYRSLIMTLRMIVSGHSACLISI